MADIYGSQAASISSSAFIWASRLTILLEGAEMNRCGTVKYGYLPLSSMMDSQGSPLGFSINNLLKNCSGPAYDLKETSTITLDGAIVDHSLVT